METDAIQAFKGFSSLVFQEPEWMEAAGLIQKVQWMLVRRG